jgi:hypothetical protein
MELKVKRNSLLNRFLSVSDDYRWNRQTDRNSSTIIKEVLNYYLKQLSIIIAICFLLFCTVNTIILITVRTDTYVPNFILQIFLFLQIIAMDNIITFFIFITGTLGILILGVTVCFLCYSFTIDIYNKIISAIGKRVVFTTIDPDQTD